MADGAAKQRGGSASKAGAATKRKTKSNAMPAAEKRKRAAARRKVKAEAARIAAMSPAELVAEEEAQQAKSGPEQTIERAQTYRAIMRDYARGLSYPALSAKHNLSARRCQEVVEALRGSELSRLGLDDPLFGVKFAQDLVVRRAAAISEYTELADGCTTKGLEHIRLGFLKQRDAAVQAFTELVQELGWLPRHLGTLNVQMDAIQMAEAMLDTMDALGVEEDVQRAIVEAIELRVVRRSGRLQLAPSTVLEGHEVEVHDGGDRDSAAAAA
jgi:hypothetical protein